MTVVARRGEAISINSIPLVVDDNDRAIPLSFGANKITILVGSMSDTPQTYTITQDLDLSLHRWSVGWQGADAQTLDLAGSNLEPDSLPRILNNMDSVTVTATVEEMMRVAINSAGNTVGSSRSQLRAVFLTARVTISGLALGENDVGFVLTAPDSRTVSYMAKVWRRYNSRLISLGVPGLPSFDPETFVYGVPPVANRM